MFQALEKRVEVRNELFVVQVIHFVNSVSTPKRER